MLAVNRSSLAELSEYHGHAESYLWFCREGEALFAKSRPIIQALRPAEVYNRGSTKRRAAQGEPSLRRGVPSMELDTPGFSSVVICRTQMFRHWIIKFGFLLRPRLTPQATDHLVCEPHYLIFA